MAHDEPPHIDSSLDPIRAAIEMVADGSARRVTVYTPGPSRLLPAARALARAAGVAIESGDGADADHDLVVAPATPRIA
jgi:hypothetical protein